MVYIIIIILLTLKANNPTRLFFLNVIKEIPGAEFLATSAKSKIVCCHVFISTINSQKGEIHVVVLQCCQEAHLRACVTGADYFF